MANIPVLPGLPVPKRISRAIAFKRGLKVNKPNIIDVVMPGSVPEALTPSYETGKLASMRGNTPVLVEPPSNPTQAFDAVRVERANGPELGIVILTSAPTLQEPVVSHTPAAILQPLVRKRKARRRIVRDE
jgi:hypothetical protein